MDARGVLEHADVPVGLAVDDEEVGQLAGLERAQAVLTATRNAAVTTNEASSGPSGGGLFQLYVRRVSRSGGVTPAYISTRNGATDAHPGGPNEKFSPMGKISETGS